MSVVSGTTRLKMLSLLGSPAPIMVRIYIFFPYSPHFPHFPHSPHSPHFFFSTLGVKIQDCSYCTFNLQVINIINLYWQYFFLLLYRNKDVLNVKIISIYNQFNLILCLKLYTKPVLLSIVI